MFETVDIAKSIIIIFHLCTTDLDSGSALEFGRWFAFHLLNTQLSWPAHYWEFWVGELQEATEAGQTAVPLFIR